MKETVDLSTSPMLGSIFDICKETLASSLQAITSAEVKLDSSEMNTIDKDTLFSEYVGQTVIKSVETNSELQLGLLFKTTDISRLSNLMLGGDETPKAELDEDTVDAVRELTNQLVMSLNVPFASESKQQVSMKVEDVAVSSADDGYTEENYISMEFVFDIAGKPVPFILFFDTGIESYLISGTKKEVASSSSGGDASSNPQQANLNLDLLLDIDIPISVRMGTAKLFLKDILGLGPGNIVELEQGVDEQIDLTINDKVIARGEVVIVDGYFGFRIKEIISRAERIRKLKD